jgi:hypothetical protein
MWDLEQAFRGTWPAAKGRIMHTFASLCASLGRQSRLRGRPSPFRPPRHGRRPRPRPLPSGAPRRPARSRQPKPRRRSGGGCCCGVRFHSCSSRCRRAGHSSTGRPGWDSLRKPWSRSLQRTARTYNNAFKYAISQCRVVLGE